MSDNPLPLMCLINPLGSFAYECGAQELSITDCRMEMTFDDGAVLRMHSTTDGIEFTFTPQGQTPHPRQRSDDPGVLQPLLAALLGDRYRKQRGLAPISFAEHGIKDGYTLTPLPNSPWHRLLRPDGEDTLFQTLNTPTDTPIIATYSHIDHLSIPAVRKIPEIVRAYRNPDATPHFHHFLLTTPTRADQRTLTSPQRQNRLTRTPHDYCSRNTKNRG